MFEEHNKKNRRLVLEFLVKYNSIETFKYSQKRCPSLLSNDMNDKESKRDIMPGFHLHFVWSKSGRYEAVHCLNNLDAKKLLQF